MSCPKLKKYKKHSMMHHIPFAVACECDCDYEYECRASIAVLLDSPGRDIANVRGYVLLKVVLIASFLCAYADCTFKHCARGGAYTVCVLCVFYFA